MNVTYYFYKTLRVTLFMGLVLTLVTALVTATVEWYFIPQLPSIEHLKDVRLKVPLRIYARDRTLIAEFGEERRMPIAAHEIPPLLIKAVLAAEDARFYDHPGVDLKGLLRAAVNLIKTGEKQQGGSTITMQVARNFFLSSERSFVRKFYEILLAWKIEKEFTKEEILELYLNKIFFGHRAYGVAAAAQVYYGRDIQELTLAEWAMLAGLPKAPSVSNPLTNSARALERRNYILGRMRELNYISEADYQQAVETPNSAQQYKLEIEVEAPHVAEMVRAYMLSKYGEEAYTNGYRVITTIEPQLQSHAQRALRSALYEYDERHGYRGPIEQVNLPKELPQLETTAAKILAEYTNYGELVPSLVLQTQRRNIIAYNLQVGEFEIDWSDLAWARRYINDNRRGRSPRRASNIVKRGDIIMARPVMEQAPKKAKTEKTQATAQTDSDEQPVENTAPPKISHWRLAEVPQIEGALVALSPTNGAIRALVGGFDYYHSKFNRVIQAERQPGSNFKPFIYSAALARGFTAASMINDAPIAFRAGNKTWMPKNYSHKYYGLTSLRKALAYSRNVASVRLLNKIGVQFAIDHVVKFGFDRERIPKNLTIALGTGDVTPLELARGFAVFANGGYRVEPFFIHEIEDTSGKIIYSSNPLKVCRTCSP
ncbi:MAG: PBP1A family penicillin-binding protein, partial [Pseudomonadota bacterium]|nr:PBP1A family penicillin-binding protein [Pseudomonadota bacterium]